MAGSTITTPRITEGPLLELADFVIHGGEVDVSLAEQLLRLPESRAYDLMYAAFLVKRHFVGDALHRCGIVNIKSGNCGEDCGFCAQSVFYQTAAGTKTYNLMSPDQMAQAAREATAYGSSNFGLVAAWKGIKKGPQLDQICEGIRRIKAEGKILPDVSLGVAGREEMQQLKEAGCVVYHHSLETSESYYRQVCTTRDWRENYDTVRYAKEAGMEICCGGILGMGETLRQRAEFMREVATLRPEHIPVNFLVSVHGTPLAGKEPLKPLECLMALAVFRLTNPTSDIFVAGGRVQQLRQLQPFLFMAGANGMMVGNYLTTPGRTKEQDEELVRDLGLGA
ncbi:MAG TPA: biotin synthase BioB [Planctomycetota bacterium]|nr:biotin synthase BioB [Planctomycetota bacterium]